MLCLWGKYTIGTRVDKTFCVPCNGTGDGYFMCTGAQDVPGAQCFCGINCHGDGWYKFPYGTHCADRGSGANHRSQTHTIRVPNNPTRCRYCNGAGSKDKTVEIAGTYLTTVTAEANAYPQNGRHSDGFWYTYLGLANKAPIISGADTDLGTVTELLHKYSINDTDPSDVITVTERLDGVQLRTFTATREVEYTISILAESGNFTASKRTNLDSGDSEEGAGLACWVEVLNGAHKLTITATDNVGASTVRTISFSKAEHELEFTLQTPLAADDLVTKTIMSITREIPTGALMQIYVCNNGFDEAPTWEDITAKVKQGEKFFFANTVKTADKWGYNLRICVQRLGAEGDCFIGSVGGNCE